MISITTNDIELDLHEVSITLKFENPMFSNKPFDTAYSYAFDLPANRHNKTVFEHAERLDSIKHIESFPVKIFIKGILFLEGSLTVQKSSNNLFSCSLNNLGLVMFKTIQEYDVEGLGLDSFTVVDDLLAEPYERKEQWEAYMDAKLTNDVADHNSTDHFFPCIYNQNAYEIRSSVLINPQLFSDSEGHYFLNQSWTGFINLYHGGGYKLTRGAIEFGLHQTSPSPCLKFFKILEAVCAKFGYTYILHDYFLNEEFEKLIVYSNKLQDSEATPIRVINWFGEGYDLNEFVPNVKGIEPFNALREMFGAVFSVVNGAVEIRSIKKIMEQESTDLTKYSEVNYSQSHSDFTNFKFYFDDDADDNLNVSSRVERVKDLILNADLKTSEVHSKNRPLVDYSDAFDASTYFSIPVFPIVPSYNGYVHTDYHNPASNSEEFEPIESNDMGENKDRFLLMFWRGMHDSGDGHIYPLASTGNRDFNGDRIGDLSMNWSDPDKGLFDYWWKDFYGVVNGAKTVSKTFFLSVHQIKKLSSFANPNVRFYHEKGQIEGLLKSFEFQASSNGITPIKANILTKNLYTP
jgi:hypothetical protein